MKIITKSGAINAERLTWANWSGVCALVGDGFTKGAMGVYLDDEGNESPNATDRIGLRIPTLDGSVIAQEGDYIVRDFTGKLFSCTSEIFKKVYGVYELA